MKKIIFACAALVTLMAFSCSPNTSSDDDQLYEQGIDKKHAKPVNH
ncbi:hypothetical protein [Maribacter sp.]|nr:hypothetical protein [Maribacter sp.]